MSRYTNYLEGLNVSDIALAEGSYNYYGYARPDGSWVVMREKTDMTEYRYAVGAKNYSFNFTNRISLTYKKITEFPQL